MRFFQGPNRNLGEQARAIAMVAMSLLASINSTEQKTLLDGWGSPLIENGHLQGGHSRNKR